MRLLLAVCIFLGSATANEAPSEQLRTAVAARGSRPLLAVRKGLFTLTVYTNGPAGPAIVERFPIAYGANPDGGNKLHVGDDRTPEGTYRIVGVLSLAAPKGSPEREGLEEMNRVFFRAKDGYHRFGLPDQDLGDNAYGPYFFRLDYPRPEDSERHAHNAEAGLIPPGSTGEPLGPGSGIAIHGTNDPASIGHRATNGCIRMFNLDIVRLSQYVRVGTAVLVEP